MRSLYRIAFLFLAFFGAFSAYSQANVNITPTATTGGVPLCVGGSPVTLTPIIISETDTGDPLDASAIGGPSTDWINITLELGIPADFQFVPGVGSAFASPGSDDVVINSITVLANSVTIDFNAFNNTGTDKFDGIIISGLQVRAISGPAQTLDIIRTGGTSTITGLVNGTVVGSVSSALPPTPVISGENSVCVNEQNVVYSLAVDTGNDYEWIVSGGTIDGSSTGSLVTVDWGSSGTGFLRVTETNPATGCSTTTADYNVTINANPTPVISGNNSVCANQVGVVYNTPAAADRTYNWTVNGGVITSGTGTNSITVTWGAAGAGTVQLEEIINTTTCSVTTPVYSVTINANPAPVIGGPATVCANESGAVYTTAATGNNFNWTVNGGTITSGQGTNSITVTWGTAGAGTVRVTETITATGCSTTTADYNVTINANPTPVISGNNSVCANQVGVVYSTPAAADRTYNWTVNGGVITSGTGTNSITVMWGAAGAGTVQLEEIINTTTCSVTTPVYSVTINANPAPVIGGPATVCANESGAVYTTAATGNNFNWTVNGGTITSGQGTNSITVTWGTAGAGTVRVTETITATGCSTTTADYNVTINANPTPVISGNNSVCANQVGVVYSTPAAADRTYNWTVNGGVITSGTGTNSITVTWGAAGAGTVQLEEIINTTICSVTTPVYSVTINANPAPVIGGPATVCANESGAVYTTAATGNNFNWTVNGGTITSGQGTNSITVTWGTAGAGTVSVTEAITATGCNTTTAPFVVTISPIALVNAGSDQEICEGSIFNFSTQSTPATASNFASLLWTTTGTGILTNATSLTPSYTPGVGEIGAITFTLTAEGLSTCSDVADQMVLNITPLPTVDAGSNGEVCAGATFNFSTQTIPASATNYASLSWSHTGTGTLFNPSSLTPTYLPGSGETGTVTFTLLVTSPGSCGSTSDQMDLVITPAPTVNAGSDEETCEGVAFNFSTQTTPASASNFNTITWTTTGTGSLTNANTLTPTYTPDAGETGNITFTLTATGNGSCATLDDQMTLTITPAATVFAGSDEETCEGVTFDFASQTTPATASNYASLLWTTTGTGSLFNATSLTPTYVPGAGETGVVTFTLTAFGMGSCADVIDQMTLTITPAVIVSAGSDEETCEGVAFNFSTQTTPASASNFNTITWTTTGTGSLTNANTLTPTYTPDAGETGNITFTLTATGNGSCATLDDQMTLTITPAATVFAGSDEETCEGVTFDFASQTTPATASNYASLLWTTTGTGSLFNATSLTPTYVPGAGETGVVTFTLTAFGMGSCADVIDQMTLTITPAVIVSAGSDEETCEGVAFNFSTQTTPASASNFNTITWTTTGTGSLTNANTLTPTYTPDAGETGNITFTLTATGNGSCATLDDQMTLTITPAATVFAGSDEETCEGVTFDFASQTTPATASNYASLLWTTTGTGSLFNATSLTPTYVPGAGETGVVTFTLTAFGMGSCADVIDQMTLTITPAVIVSAGSDEETCEGVAFNFSTQTTPASASNFNTITWTTTGTGSLTNANTLTPTYTPDAGETGNITFTLTATGNGSCATLDDQMTLTITPAATVFAGSDEETCEGVTFDFASQTTPATASNYASLLWTTTGTGSLFNATSLTPTYVPGAGETGVVTFTLTAFGMGSCADVIDQMTLTITPAVIVSAGSDEETCEGVAFNFSTQTTPASASNFNTITWTTTGTGSLTNANTLTPTYTPDAGETGNITFTLTATGNGSCATLDDQMTLTITPAATVFAGSDEETCEGVTFDFASQTTPATASNYASLLWTTTGTGSLFNATSLTPTYVPGAGETGVVTFTLTAFGMGSCADVIDQMTLTITPAVIVSAGSDEETCEGVAFNFSTQTTPASASNFNTITWTTTGTGSLTNANTLTPTYTPDAGETGNITFTLTATGNGSCATLDDQMTLTITPAATVFAGSDEETCEGVTFDFASQTTPATASNYASLLWTTTGTGSLFNATSLTPTYVPGAGETGVVTFTLTAFGMGSCADVIDQMTLTITPAVIVSAGSDEETCEGVAFNFSTQTTPASASNFNTITWTTTGTGSLTNANTLTPTYTPDAGETGNITFTLTATGNGSCATLDDQMTLTITPAATVFAGSDEETCEGVTFDFASQTTPATASNYASLLWTTTGTGSLFNATSLTPTYVPGAGETGVVTFTLTAFGMGSCADVIDQMTLTITPAVIVSAGSDEETCEGVAFNFSTQTTPASASNFNTITWTTTGTGSLTNANTLTPTYTPDAGETGNITFTLTATGNGSCATLDDQMTLTITPAATVFAGSDEETCEGVTFDFASQTTPATASNYASLLWTTTGTGSLFNATSLTPTYVPGAGETGVVTFTLTAFGMGSCADVIDQMTLTITPAVIVSAGSDEETCEGVAFNFSTQTTPASASNFNTITWTTTGTGSLTNANTLTPTYTPDAGETGNITFTLTATGNGSCATLDDQMTLTITPAATVFAGSDEETCEGVTFDFASQTTPATASNYASLLWTTTGTGSLFNATSLTPTYVPGAGETGVVTFTLTAFGMGSCADVIDQMTLTITPAVIVSAGSDEETCEGVAFNFSTQTTPASASNFNTITWTTTGTGSLTNANTLTPTYTPDAGETGNITFTLTATGNGSCATLDDQMTLTITPAATVFAGSDEETCEGVTFDFASQTTPATASNYASLLWTTTGTGSLFNATSLTPTYVPGAGETGVVTFTLTAFGMGSCADVIDQMTLTITPAVIVSAGSDEETCEGVAFSFSTQTTPASASNFNTITWTTTGTGSLTNANTLTPTYTPDAGETGNITFTLTATGNGSCATLDDQMTLTITPAATVFAGSDEETCEGVTFDFASQTTPATASNYASLLWTTTGTGSLFNATSLTPTYVPGAGETGVVTFTLTAFGMGSCADVIDQMTLTITPAVIVSAGSDEETCEGVAFNFSTQTTPASASNFNTITWTTTGTGSLTNANTLTPTYTPDAGETGNITFTLTATGNGSCATLDDQMTLTITPAATVFAGSDEETCEGVTFDFASQTTPATATNFLSILWTTTGTGAIANANTLTPTYTPGVGETGNVIFTLTATGNGSCVTVQDEMTLVITPAPVLSAGSDAETCQGVNFDFSTQSVGASASNYATITWTTTGTGVLFNPNTLTPTYQPGVGEAGNVTFSLTATGNGSCATIQDQMILTITPSVIVSAGSDEEICEGVVFNFTSQSTAAAASNFSSILWATSGTGSLTNANTLTPTYTPGVDEIGNVTFTLTAFGNGSCISRNDEMILHITPAVIVDAGSNAEICQGGVFIFSSRVTPATASNYSALNWSHTGSGTLFDATTLTPTYFAAPGETGVVTFTLTAVASGSCSNQSDDMIITIIPGPTVNAGSNDAICEGTASFDFSTRSTIATASNGTWLWSHNGTGSLNDDAALNPVYTVGVGDVGNVVTFTLTVTSPSAECSVVTSSFELRVNPQALASVPAPLIDVCEPSRINLSGSIGGSATSGSWSLVSGAGTLSISSITGLNVTATYDTHPTDVGSILTFRLTTNDPDGTGPCSVAFADIDYNIEESAKVFAGVDFSICEYDDITLNGSFSGSATSVTWTGGTNNFDVATNPITGYTLSDAERLATNLSITFTLTTNDPPGVCPAVSDEVVVMVKDTLNFVTIVGLDPVYAENSPPVSMSAVPPGGTFFGPGVSGNTFFPSIANLTPATNIITYSYQDPATGCYSSPVKSVIVNPITNVNFRVQNEQPDPLGLANGYICANQGDLTLIEDPLLDIPGLPPPQAANFSSPDLPAGSIYFDGASGKFKLRTDGLTTNEYTIIYEFTNEFGAMNPVARVIRVTASPTSIIDVTNSCITSTITFTESSTIIGSNKYSAYIAQYLWQFGDGNGSTSQEPNYQYTVPNTYSVTLRVTTNEGCSNESAKMLRVGPVPQMNFTWSEFCNGNDTKFVDQTDAGISNIESYTWTFDDGFSVTGLAGEPIPAGTNGGRTSNLYAAPNHRYDLFGEYNVQLTVTTDDGCTNSITRRVFIQEYGTPSPTNHYFEDFEAGQGTWVKTVANNGALKADDIATDTSWVFGTPFGLIINSGAGGSTNAWWTGNNPASGIENATYYLNEKSAVIGPCLNLSDIKRPMISLDYWSDMEDQRDGAVLQYSIDGGTNWHSVGDISGAGINWYNRGALVANPGLQPIGQYGWTGIQSGWKTARFNLDMIPEAERNEVIFRIAFGSTTDKGNPSRPYEGFAFDNIFIGEKQRNVLVEYFTNAGISGTSNDYLNNLYTNQFTFKDSSDFFKIQYHIANPSADAINAENPIDPAARSLYYGVSQPPAAIMDGVLGNYFGTSFNGDQTKITAIEVDRRALEDPLFAIDVTQNPTTNDSINLTVDYKYIAQQSVTTPYTFQVALVEGNVGGNVNVLRKLLLGSEGVTINATWNTNTVQTIPVKNIVNVPIQDGNNLYLVAFVQDRNTKRIHQSRVIKSVYKVPSTVVGIGDDPVFAQIKDIQVFPNPASKIVNFGIDSGFGNTLPIQGYTWSIIDQRGVEVLRGSLNEDLSDPQQVELNALANGMYIITFSKGSRVVVQKKLAVMNRH